MFWDKAAGLYDLFENIYNGKVNRKLVSVVAELVDGEDRVLECACGTGMISKGIAQKGCDLIATDFSIGMLKQAKKNLAGFPNAKVMKADIMRLKTTDDSFDKVVAGNVIHLLDKPYDALDELMRVCKDGGKIIIPTYVNRENEEHHSFFIKMIEKFGAGFKCQFDYESYMEFFENVECSEIEFIFIEGRMPCAVAVITK